MNILRDFGKGVGYIFVVPAYIIGLALASVVGVVLFLFNTIIYIVKFFAGMKMGTLTREDKEGKEVIKNKINQMQGLPSVTRAEIVEPIPAPEPQYQAPISQQIEQAPIQQAHQIAYKEEPIITRIEQQPMREQPQIEAPKEEPQPEPQKEEEPEEYNPRTSKF